MAQTDRANSHIETWGAPENVEPRTTSRDRVRALEQERDMLLVERASLSDDAERLRGLLREAVHYLDSCGCDDEECPGRQKAAQLREALR